MENKPNCEGSEAIETDYFHCDKETENIKDKETSSTIETSDIPNPPQKKYQNLMSLHFQYKVIQFILTNILHFDEIG